VLFTGAIDIVNTLTCAQAAGNLKRALTFAFGCVRGYFAVLDCPVLSRGYFAVLDCPVLSAFHP